MENWKVSYCKKIILFLVACGLLLSANSTPSVAADSGCLTCHLDAEMLKKNLSVVKEIASTMQAGTG